MTGNEDWPSERRSQQYWQDSAQPQNLAERLVRVEEGLRHTLDKAQTASDRFHGMANRLMGYEARLTVLETEQRRHGETMAKVEPLAMDFQRRRDRRQILKDTANWLTVPAVAYLAFSGKASMADVLAALAKMFGAH